MRLENSVLDKNFTGSPFYITTIATLFDKMGMENYLKLEDTSWPKIDLVDLYEAFVERKFHIYLTEKQKADITNYSVLVDHEFLQEMYLKCFEKCALVDILPPHMLKSLYNKEIEEEIQPFLGRVLNGNEKIGIVMNVVDGKPQFLHLTMAEYFTARWFSRNFEFNRSVTERILFDRTYGVMTDMLDRILAKDFPLHCAVLNRDNDLFEMLVREGFDVNAVDKGGRTVMHIIATRLSTSCDIINHISQYQVSLDSRDNVLQWTPLQYAIKSENWFTVERLLEGNVDRSGLDMIRQTAQDPHYINSLILHAAEYGYSLLLEFLRSIDVNIHQASSTDFPSLLHADKQGEQLPVDKCLTQHGANCNTRYSDGKVTESSVHDVRKLEAERVASLDVYDKKGQ
jgi:hypothetical protein